MDSDFDSHKALEEANERHEHAVHAVQGKRWIPIAAALLAVIAALANLASNQRSTDGLLAKNEAILAQAKESDAYNLYEARSIKEHTYEAFLNAGLVHNSKRIAEFTAISAHERTEKTKSLAQAHQDEQAVIGANERSERALHSHEILEVAVTSFEVAIVLVSISALIATPILSVTAISAAAIGAIVFAFGLLSH
ncbi:MAG TPA: DUF4337 family protein [Candidatus Baltobacteraceae bacterium]|jgi:hypothetical protein|nr:DUF4337 family protein [Candidatus Baltobacteraceae bacterium]